MDAAEILHPIRLRIVQLLLGEAGLTTTQLSQRLSDVPIATLYRHIGRLGKSDVIVVEKSVKVRGAVEKTYRLNDSFAQLGYGDFAKLKPEEMNAIFIAFCAGLIADFAQYTGSGDVNLARDQVQFSQVPVWATDTEMTQFNETLSAGLDRLHAQTPDAGRNLRIFTSILMPRLPAKGSDRQP